MVKFGVVLGRFQPLHKGHLQYILSALDESKALYIGITTPGKSPTPYEPKDPARFGPKNNPFTYSQRKQMIKAALSENNVDLSRITFIHFKPNKIKAWFEKVPGHAVYFLVPESKGEREKAKEMENQGLNVKFLKFKVDKDYQGINIRRKMIDGKKWKHLLPKSVADYIKNVISSDRII